MGKCTIRAKFLILSGFYRHTSKCNSAVSLITINISKLQIINIIQNKQSKAHIEIDDLKNAFIIFFVML